MKKVLTIGGATQDIFLHYGGADIMTIHKKDTLQNYMLFESGEKLEIDTLTLHTGGGATNAAVSFARLGFDASIFCIIGQDPAGQHILHDIKTNKVDMSYIKTLPRGQTGTSCIINNLKNERTIFAFRGLNSTLDVSTLDDTDIKQFNHIYITSLSGNAAKHLPSLTTRAYENRLTITINPGTSQLTQGLLTLKQSLPHINTLILNSSEARTFMNSLAQSDDTYKATLESKSTNKPCTLNTADPRPYLMESPLACQNNYLSMRNFFKEILKMGPKIVVITNGANGVYVASEEKIYFHPSMKLKVVNTVGAGDAFGSCFTASLLFGASIEQALRYGIINSGSVLSHIGAKEGLLDKEKLLEQSKGISEKLIQTFTL